MEEDVEEEVDDVEQEVGHDVGHDVEEQVGEDVESLSLCISMRTKPHGEKTISAF